MGENDYEAEGMADSSRPVSFVTRYEALKTWCRRWHGDLTDIVDQRCTGHKDRSPSRINCTCRDSPRWQDDVTELQVFKSAWSAPLGGNQVLRYSVQL